MLFNNLISPNFYDNKYLYLLIFSIIFIPLLTTFINTQCKKFNLLDVPNERKNHKFPTPISGGIIILISLFIFYFLLQNILFIKLYFFLDILLISTIFFFIGAYDDKKNPKTILKINLILILLLSLTVVFDDFVVQELRFKYFFQDGITLKYLSIPFTIFCIFMFFNALNYADGKNGVCITYVIFVIIFLSSIQGDFKEFYFLNILTLIILLFYNLRDKLFLGNNGVNLLSIYLSLIIIKTYNLKSFDFYCDEIFLLMLIPGIDATRVTVQRIYKKISPVKPDKKHLHHYLSILVQDKFVWILYLLLSSSPIILLNYSENFLLSILLPLLIYFFVIFKVTKNTV